MSNAPDKQPSVLAGIRSGLGSIAIGVALAAASSGFLIDSVPDEPGLPDGWQRGVNLTAFLPEAYAEPSALEGMISARDAGADRVALIATNYMETRESSSVFADREKTPTDESLLSAAQSAKRLGLDVILKPHVDVLDGTFRGEIEPDDRDAWFDSYSEMMLRYAEVAGQIGAGDLIIGTELTSVSGGADTERWRELIAEARQIYGGRISFAANWVDGAERVSFWDELDYIGIDAYMPLETGSPVPAIEELKAAWRPFVSRMEKLHEQWGKQIVFTELGYESFLQTSLQTEGPRAVYDEQAQADAYRAAFASLRHWDWFDGIWWWEWSAELKDPEQDWTPEGKAAEQALVEWQGRSTALDADPGTSLP